MSSTEYALIHNGRIMNVVMTSQGIEGVRALWPDYEVKPLDDCPEEQLKAYRYWDERP